MKAFIFIALACFIGVSISRHSADEWKSRVIYQVITDRFAGGSGNCDLGRQPYYCGGNFNGLVDKLDYIKGMGFNAIWVSPIVENTNNGFHGYWLKDLYKINSHFGGEGGFKNLVNAAHAKDIWIMVDVVGNHVGPIGDDFGQINPFNKGEHYHSNCDIQDWNNQWQVENCRLAGLPDLKQENGWVKDTLKNWINDWVSKYDIDGLRIDTIPEVPKWFWSEFTGSAGCYCVGEVFNGNQDYVFSYVDSVGGVLNYPVYFTARSVFGYQQTMKNLEGCYRGINQHGVNQYRLGVFADNHDNARFRSYQGDKKKLESYVTFSLSAIGIPIVYYATEQYYAGGNDPYNREALWPNYNTNSGLYKRIGLVNYYRQKVKWYNSDQLQCYADDDFYAFQRGGAFFAFTNKNYNIKRHITYNKLGNGRMCNIFNKSDCINVNNKTFDIYLDNGESKIYVYDNVLEESDPQFTIEE